MHEDFSPTHPTDSQSEHLHTPASETEHIGGRSAVDRWHDSVQHGAPDDVPFDEWFDQKIQEHLDAFEPSADPREDLIFLNAIFNNHPGGLDLRSVHTDPILIALLDREELLRQRQTEIRNEYEFLSKHPAAVLIRDKMSDVFLPTHIHILTEILEHNGVTAQTADEYLAQHNAERENTESPVLSISEQVQQLNDLQPSGDARADAIAIDRITNQGKNQQALSDERCKPLEQLIVLAQLRTRSIENYLIATRDQHEATVSNAEIFTELYPCIVTTASRILKANGIVPRFR